MTDHTIPYGAKNVSYHEITDALGSISVGKVEWISESKSYRTELNGLVLEAKNVAPMLWVGLVNSKEAVGRADNAPDVMHTLLEKATL